MGVFAGVRLNNEQLDNLVYNILVQTNLEDVYIPLHVDLYIIRRYLNNINFDILLYHTLGVRLEFPTIDHNYFLCGVYTISSNIQKIRRYAYHIAYQLRSMNIYNPPYMFFIE